MTKAELEDMTKDELVNYADDYDIEVHHHWTKDEIIKEIMKAERAMARQEAKQNDEPKAAAQSAAEPPAVEPAEGQSQIDPKLAALQELAQQLPDPSTRFASKPAPGEKADE